MDAPPQFRFASPRLRGEYQAVIIELACRVIGYALFRREPEHAYLRQALVRRSSRANIAAARR